MDPSMDKFQHFASTLDTPTLGRPVLLGELYDQRKSQFLGVQLYDKAKMDDATTSININYTDLSLRMSNTFKDKASVIDINAELSVQILCGLVKVKGSAAYLNDTKSNSREHAWAMSLSTRLTESRLLFAQDSLGNNILDWAKGYIANGTATHFVSSIVYGGNVVVNLVSRRTRFTKEEKVEGSLRAKLETLKGAIDLNGKADLHIGTQFEDLNDKFDIIVRNVHFRV